MAVYADSDQLQYKPDKGRPLSAVDWCPILLKIRETLHELKKVKYNMCVVNRYANGDSNNGMHADDDDNIDQSVPVCNGWLFLIFQVTFSEKNYWRDFKITFENLIFFENMFFSHMKELVE